MLGIDAGRTPESLRGTVETHRYRTAISAGGRTSCRDVSEHEPFDFVTWFEYAPGDAAAFDDLLAELRVSEEWRYVDREVDVRLVRD
jgi:hypothetical protein